LTSFRIEPPPLQDDGVSRIDPIDCGGKEIEKRLEGSVPLVLWTQSGSQASEDAKRVSHH